LPEDILMAALESLVPAYFETYLQMNSTKFDSLESMRVEIVRYAASKSGSRIRESKIERHDGSRDGYDAIEIDSLAKGKGKSGGGKDKFQGLCHTYGKYRHRASECWWQSDASNGKNAKNSGGKGSASFI
jgi:hypothetical protein